VRAVLDEKGKRATPPKRSHSINALIDGLWSSMARGGILDAKMIDCQSILYCNL